VFPANSLAEIRSTILGISRPKRKSPEARSALAAFAIDNRRRGEELDRAGEKLRSDRDEAIRTAYNDGMAMSDIAAVLDLSHQRVSQIIRS
jgi:DNA-directed RNA polymerase specialized sigma subunit